MKDFDFVSAGAKLEPYIRSGRITVSRATEILMYLDFRRGREIVNRIADEKQK